MVVLDADSIMHGDTLVSLVRLMEQHPRAGIVQTLPQGFGHGTVHARLQQFGNRVTGRLFALGMAYWQLGESHYWGHNAILRVAPFMRHCALGTLPGRGGLAGEILSHDFVEAALMRRAGYEVWLAPQLGGSWEQHPANLLEELQRDRRWCQGNLQNARLLAEPGWRPGAPRDARHRRAVLPGGTAVAGLRRPRPELRGLQRLQRRPVAADLAAAAAAAAAGRAGRATARRAERLSAAACACGAAQRSSCCCRRLQAPLRMLAHSAFVLAALTGLRLDWKSPSREAAAVAWRDAMSRIGLLALPALGLALLTLVLHGSDLQAPYLAPLLLPLLLAVPFTVWSGGVGAGRLLQRTGLLSVPEERKPPRALQRGAHKIGFDDLMPAPVISLAQPALQTRGRAMLALASVALVALLMLPRTALSPEFPPGLMSFAPAIRGARHRAVAHRARVRGQHAAPATRAALPAGQHHRRRGATPRLRVRGAPDGHRKQLRSR